jgi:hypothetical protein
MDLERLNGRRVENIHQQLWGYKIEEKLHLRVCERKRLNTTGL